MKSNNPGDLVEHTVHVCRNQEALDAAGVRAQLRRTCGPYAKDPESPRGEGTPSSDAKDIPKERPRNNHEKRGPRLPMPKKNQEETQDC